MTNSERYRRTFGALHVSGERLKEVYEMENRKKLHIGRMILIGACVMALLTVSAFAANEVTGGKVFEKITVFVNGALVDGFKGSYTANGDGSYTIETEDGQQIHVTTVGPSRGEMMSEDGQIHYDVSYKFEFDDTEVHDLEVQMDGVVSESVPAVDVNP